MTKALRFVYNICCHCKKRALCLVADTLPIPTLRRCHYAQNLPTQKASEKERAWFQKENEDCRRQKRSEEKTCKGQKETDLLISYYRIAENMTDAPHRSFFLSRKISGARLRCSSQTSSTNDKFAIACLLRYVSPHLLLFREQISRFENWRNQIFVLFFTRAYMRVRAGGQAAVAM